MASDIEWLQQWYAQNCNGDWEHQYGLTIGTLDNPGWSVAINLRGTPLESKPFEQVEFGADNDNDWYFASIQNDEEYNEGPVFAAHCSPKHLATVIGLFKAFAEKGI